MSPFQKLRNFRDVGGLQTVDGRTLRTGVFYRSDDPSRLTSRDRTALLEFDIQFICDLRSPAQSRKKPARLDQPIRTVNLSLHEPAKFDLSRPQLLAYLFGDKGGDRFREFIHGYYHHIAFERAAQVRDILTLLAKEKGPALIHCTAGKDRTGFIVALLQLSAGVPYDTVLAHYLETNDSFAPSLAKFIRLVRRLTLRRVTEERIRAILMAHAEHLNEVHGEILKRHGSVDGYLVDGCGIHPGVIEQLRRRLLS